MGLLELVDKAISPLISMVDGYDQKNYLYYAVGIGFLLFWAVFVYIGLKWFDVI